MKRMNGLILLWSLLAANASFASSMVLESSVLNPKKEILSEQVFNNFGCTGANVSPDLQWSGSPKETKAFAVTAFDLDAPTGSGWWHWVIINIPKGQSSLEAGASGKAAALGTGALETRTDFGKPGYGGPCPPAGSGAHRYIFKVYALKDLIPLDADASGAMVGFYINNLKIAEGTLKMKYGRK